MFFHHFLLITPAGVPKVPLVFGAILFWHFAIHLGLKEGYLGAQKELEGVLGL